jgi:hypothetical protein
VPRLARARVVVQDGKHDQRPHSAACSRVVPDRTPWPGLHRYRSADS